MKDEDRRAPRRSGIRRLSRLLRPSSFILLVLAASACTERQQGEPVQDVEPERLVNTDLSFPKNPQRWVYVSARVSTDPKDPFPGFRVVVANPFGARAREERVSTSRGTKFAQFVYEPTQTSAGIAPGALRRVNVLVQDAERYASTGGWGYASFDGSERPIAVEPRTDCVVCHTSGPISALAGP
jgi:hypothetical protein